MGFPCRFIFGQKELEVMDTMLTCIIRSVLYALLLVIGLSMLVVLCYASIRDDICFDSTILLTEVERVAEGYIPYKTLHLNYPPLWFYMMVGLKRLFHVPYGCYNFYFVVNLLMLVICAFAEYKIAYRLCRSRLASLVTSWLFLFLCMINGGLNVLFEVPSLMFGLMGIWLTGVYLEKDARHYIWIGALISCSFMVKQFGLGFIVLAMLVLFLYGKSRDKWRKILFLLCGFLLVFLVTIAIFRKPFIDSVFFNSYSAHLNATLFDRVHNTSHMLRNFVRKAPVILAAIILLPAFLNQGKWRWAIVLACAICGFSLQFMFMVDASHYYMYLIPFAVLYLPLFCTLKLTASEHLLIYVTLFFLLYVNLTLMANVTKIRIKANNREIQITSGAALSSVIPSQTKVWIADDGALPIYYFANLKTPNMEKYGYCAGKFQISESMASDQVASADFVICTATDEPLTSQDAFFTFSLRECVTSHDSTVISYMGRTYLLYDMRN